MWDLSSPVRASHIVLVVKNPPAKAGDASGSHSISGSGGAPEEGHGNPLQCICLENPMDREAWTSHCGGFSYWRAQALGLGLISSAAGV